MSRYFCALDIRNQHDGEKRNQRSEQQAVDEDHEAGALEILELRRGDFAVDLRQAFFAAHGEQGVADADQNRNGGDVNYARALQPAERFIRDVDIVSSTGMERADSRG